MAARSGGRQHTGEDLEAEVLFVAKPVGAALEDADLVVEPLERLTEQVERLARHAFRGELWENAVTYLRQASAKAFLCSADRERIFRSTPGP